MWTDTIRATLDRDLRALVRELAAYPDDDAVWRDVPGMTNSTGTLALHVAGNLQHFVGTVLGKTGYVRQRDAEFSRRGVPRAELTAELERARAAVNSVLGGGAKNVDPAGRYPLADLMLSGTDLLVHLVSHAAYHLGQADYHRRAVTGAATGVHAVSPRDLPSAGAG